MFFPRRTFRNEWLSWQDKYRPCQQATLTHRQRHASGICCCPSKWPHRLCMDWVARLSTWCASMDLHADRNGFYGLPLITTSAFLETVTMRAKIPSCRLTEVRPLIRLRSSSENSNRAHSKGQGQHRSHVWITERSLDLIQTKVYVLESTTRTGY